MKHENGTYCPRCDEKLSEADPYMASWFEKIKELEPEAHVSWSYRGKEDQEKAFQEGKSKLHYPNSPHNFTEDGVPKARALDLFCLTDDGRALWPVSWFHKIADLSGKDIVWGGNFKHLGDFDHFQMP